MDELLAMAAREVGCSASDLKPVALLPGGFGLDTVVKGDAVVLFCDGPANPVDEEDASEGPRHNARATLLWKACGRAKRSLAGAARRAAPSARVGRR